MKKPILPIAMILLGLALPRIPAPAQGQPLSARLTSLILPELVFREASLQEVVDHLIQKSRELDPSGEGVNILLRTDPKESQAKRLTLSAKKPTSIKRALDLICAAADVSYYQDGNTLIVRAPARVESRPKEPAKSKK